jgi:hypothetical protein
MGKTGAGVAKIQTLDSAEAIAQTQIGHASIYGVGGVDTLAGKLL